MEDQQLKEAAEARLKQWGVVGNEYGLTAHTHLLGPNLEKVLGQVSFGPLQAEQTDRLWPWNLDPILDTACRQAEVGFLTTKSGKPELEPAPRKVEKVE